VVGDNDQAIYRFAAAPSAASNFFLQRFAGWKEGEDSTPYRVALMENYRSHAEYPARGHASHRDERGQPRISQKSSASQQIRRRKNPHRRNGIPRRRSGLGGRPNSNAFTERPPLRDFAVSTASTRIAIIWWRQLSQRKIPFVISNLSILEHPLVRDVLAYLRLIAKPFDNIALRRASSPRPPGI